MDSKENRLTPDVSASFGLMISLYHGHSISKNSVVMKDKTTAFHMLRFLGFFSLNQMRKKKPQDLYPVQLGMKTYISTHTTEHPSCFLLLIHTENSEQRTEADVQACSLELKRNNGAQERPLRMERPITQE